MNDSAELLLARTPKDAEKSLEIISEALMISANSEKLIEMKAEALFLVIINLFKNHFHFL